MKKVLPFLTTMVALSLRGQGLPAPGPGEIPGNLPLPLFQFSTALSGTNEVPPNSSTATGTGTFTLQGSLFTYQVFTPLPFVPSGASIHGPAGPGGNASALFDLDGPTFVPPDPAGGGAGFAFVGNRLLSVEQISQLVSGLWYVNVRSADFPQGEIRGQIPPLTQVSFQATLNAHNEVRPNRSRSHGIGEFTLTGNMLAYSIALDERLLPISAGIFGPAHRHRPSRNLVSSLAMALGVLIPPGGIPGEPGSPGQVLYTGTVALSDSEVSDLNRGLLYANVATARYPDGEVRGQIVPVRPQAERSRNPD